MKRYEYFASRVTHFLKGFRKKANLTQSELAEKLGTTKSTVSRIENNQDKQVTFVLGLLENLGKLENMDLGDFINYLDSNKTSAEEGTLFPWQKEVLSALMDVKQSLRLDFVAEVIGQEKDLISDRIDLLVKINRLPPSSIKLVANLTNELSKIKE